MISERTLSDLRNIFTRNLREGGLLSEENCVLSEKLYQQKGVEPTVVVYLSVTLELAVSRIKKRNGDVENAITLN